jgi:hypothetical protein
MPNYRENSKWNDEMELRCLLIFKTLEEEGFPRNGRQMELCNELSTYSKISLSSLNAKVGNYKSEAGITEPSNSSSNTRRTYKQYGNLSSTEIESEITKLFPSQN